MNTLCLYRADLSLAAIHCARTYDDACSSVEAAIRAVEGHRHHNRWRESAGLDSLDFDFDVIIDSLKNMRSLMPGNYDYMSALVWRDWLFEMVLPVRKLVAEGIANNGQAA